MARSHALDSIGRAECPFLAGKIIGSAHVTTTGDAPADAALVYDYERGAPIDAGLGLFRRGPAQAPHRLFFRLCRRNATCPEVW
ncbi:hypothetical protein [Streptomyces sp. B6B3]|uniref:hypothetical protein n=1 Tax=Streptomyces sp. B6B3 TaxID=3153570 RepID=UPI00325EA705